MASTTTQLRLIIGETSLQQYVGHERASLLLGYGQLTQLLDQKTSPTSRSHASILARHMSHHDAGTNRLALYMHSLGLLSEQLESLLSPEKTSKQKLSPDEIRQLEQVQDLMQKNIAEPITEEFLCTAMGISRSKLKEGFRYLFNSTPHKMLVQQWRGLEPRHCVKKLSIQIYLLSSKTTRIHTSQRKPSQIHKKH